MIEIKGKVNAAICYATVVEGEAIEQIRRMCEALGYEVKDLLRVRVMNITLDGLKEGKYRKLTDRELNELDQLLEQSSSLPGGRESRQERKDGAGKK